MYEREPIVQHRDLLSTENIDHPEKISVRILTKWWNAANQICQYHNFSAIAFNQISHPTLDKIGFKNNNPSIIYIGKIANERTNTSEQLLINPEIQTSSLLGNSLSIEGCGSVSDIEGILPRMFVIRPEHIQGEAYFWKPGEKTAVRKSFSAYSATSSVIQHEFKHLEGKTILSDPWQIVDFTDEYIRKAIDGEFMKMDNEILIRILANFPKWIIYDFSEDKIKFISQEGKALPDETLK